MGRSLLPRPKTKLGAVLLISFMLALIVEIAEAFADKLVAHHTVTLDTAVWIYGCLAVVGVPAGLTLWSGGAVWVYRWLRSGRKAKAC